MTPLIPDAIAYIIDALHRGGHEAYLVGGCVRDRLLGFEPYDYDVCTSALPDQMKACFGKGFKVYETGLKHGTLTVSYGGMTSEVTTFRCDGTYSDGRHPDAVSFTPDLSEDLARRDFTVNAMALSPDGEVIDLYGGRQDLARGIIRAVGEPKKRFGEDALRILRALRFASRLGFQIEERTSAALFECRGLLSLISRERIAVEITGIVMGRDAQRITGEYAKVLAAAGITPSVVENDLPADDVIRLAALCAADGAGVHTLKLSNAKRDAVLALIEDKERPLPRDRVQARRLLHDRGEEGARRLCAMRNDAAALCAVEEAVRSGVPYKIHALAVNGSHLQQLGYKGEEIGKKLGAALDAVMEERIENRKDAILEYLK